MARFEIQTPEGRFEVEAPDEGTALKALGMGGAPEPSMDPGRFADAHAPGGEAGAEVIMDMARRRGGPDLDSLPNALIRKSAAQQPGGDDSFNDRAHTFLGGMIEGVPILGPPLRRGLNNVGAGVRSLMNDTPYAQEKEFVNRRGEELAGNHPGLDMFGQLAGGVGSVGAGLATKLGKAAFGLAGGSLPSRIARGVFSSGALGGGDVAVRGGSARDVAKGALVTGAIGGAIPLASPILSWLGRIRPSRSAVREVGSALGRDQVSPAALRQMNPRGMAADAGLNTAAQAEKIASVSGKAQSTLKGAVAGRAGNAQAMRDELDEVAEVEFRQALKGARPVDINSLIGDITEATLPRGGPVATWTNWAVRVLTDKNGLPLYDPAMLHRAQTTLRRQAEKLGKSANGDLQTASGILNDVRQAVIDRIEESAGAGYRVAQKHYATAMAEIEAMGLEGPASQALEAGLKRSAAKDAGGLNVRNITGLGLEAGIPTATYFLGGGLEGAAAAAAAIGARRLVALALRSRDKAKAAKAAKLLTMPPAQLAAILERAEQTKTGLAGLLVIGNLSTAPKLVAP